jgi:hypothetical protein
VNDAFVMDAWGKSVGAGDKVLMLADGNGQFAKALGVELDLADKGLGTRSRRYALLAEDQVGWLAAHVGWRGWHRVACVQFSRGGARAAGDTRCWQKIRWGAVRRAGVAVGYGAGLAQGGVHAVQQGRGCMQQEICAAGRGPGACAA